MKRHARQHGRVHVADLGTRRDWQTRRLHERGLWCDFEPYYLVRDDSAERFTGAMADVVFDYCCMRFMAGQRVPE